MTPRELSIDVQQSLVKTLKNYFPETFPEEKKIGPMPTPDVNWENAAPLLAQITTDRTLAKTLKNEFNLLKDSRYIIQNLNEICDLFTHKGLLQEEKIANPYWYRLPIIMGEYPRHTKVINKAIKTFNQLIENFHKTKKEIDNV